MAYARRVEVAIGITRPVAQSVPVAPRGSWTAAMPRHNTALVRCLFAIGAALSDLGAIVATSVATGVIYHLALYDRFAPVDSFLQVGFIIGLLVLVPKISRSDYELSKYISFQGHFRRLFLQWNIAFLSALALGFMTKTSSIFSRATVFAFYICGFAALLLVRIMIIRISFF